MPPLSIPRAASPDTVLATVANAYAYFGVKLNDLLLAQVHSTIFNLAEETRVCGSEAGGSAHVGGEGREDGWGVKAGNRRALWSTVG